MVWNSSLCSCYLRVTSSRIIPALKYAFYWAENPHMEEEYRCKRPPVMVLQDTAYTPYRKNGSFVPLCMECAIQVLQERADEVEMPTSIVSAIANAIQYIIDKEIAIEQEKEQHKQERLKQLEKLVT